MNFVAFHHNYICIAFVNIFCRHHLCRWRNNTAMHSHNNCWILGTIGGAVACNHSGQPSRRLNGRRLQMQQNLNAALSGAIPSLFILRVLSNLSPTSSNALPMLFTEAFCRRIQRNENCPWSLRSAGGRRCPQRCRWNDIQWSKRTTREKHHHNIRIRSTYGSIIYICWKDVPKADSKKPNTTRTRSTECRMSSAIIDQAVVSRPRKMRISVWSSFF